jgi:hypothetical protein
MKMMMIVDGEETDKIKRKVGSENDDDGDDYVKVFRILFVDKRRERKQTCNNVTYCGVRTTKEYLSLVLTRYEENASRQKKT